MGHSMASERDIQDIINTLIAEGVGEGEEGMRRIAETILNRAEQRGISPAEVVRQRAQYTGYSAPGPAARAAQSNPQAISAAQAAWNMAQGPDDPTGGANHYFNPNIVTPSWARAMTPTGQYGNHAFYTDRPQRPIPRQAPTPATPSIDMAQMRRISAPSQLIPDTFSRLPQSTRNLGDEIGMSPIQGGQQQAPLFDAGFDTRTNEMRMFSGGPQDTQGVFTAASRAPAPVPRMPSPQLAAQRATDPVLQAALNERYSPRPSASDRVRGNPMQTRNQATTVASIPTTQPRITASDRVRGNPMQTRNEATTIARYPTTYPTTEQITAATGFRPPPAIPNRLPQGVSGLPELYGNGNVAGVGTQAIAPMPFNRPPAFPGTQMAQAPRVAPIPFQRPTAVGSQLSVQPRPPMPIPRPPMGMGGPERPAPIPATMSPFMAIRRSLPQMPSFRPPTSPAAQRVWMTGFTGAGTSGGAHGGKADDDDNNPYSGKGRSR
jgi:hypothetical protein